MCISEWLPRQLFESTNTKTLRMVIKQEKFLLIDFILVLV